MVDTLARRTVQVTFNGIPRATIHDLRTPLTSIRGYAQLLLRGVGTEEQAQRAHETIFREAERLCAMLDKLSHLTEVTMGTLELCPERLGLDAVAVSAVLQARERWPGHTITHRSTPSVEVISDRRYLNELLTSLLDNAACYSSLGSTIETSVDEDGSRGRVAVADQGIGIPPHELETVFDCFRRASNVGRAGEAGSHGLGIGLFLARSYAAQLGGELWAESEDGRGSTLRVSLPLAAKD